MHEDLIDAVAWAVREGIARPDKVAITGVSYGGYATLVGLTFPNPRPLQRGAR
jgi:dipeptidyl aminopeptidase/acylaminoacyl peptidase